MNKWRKRQTAGVIKKTKARLLTPSLGGKTSSVNVLLKAKLEYGFEEVLDGVGDFLGIR
jgi:hypothetical protein